MTPDPIIVSVPHCGTRFLKERLGIKDHVHVTHEWEYLVKRITGRHIILPLRRPDSVWRSWCRRHEKRNFPYAEYYLAWGCLQAVANMFEVDVICVDKQQDARINDWAPIGNEDASRARWELIKTDQRAMFNLPLVRQHYGPYTAP